MASAAGSSPSWRFVAACALGAAALRVLGCGVDTPVEDPTEGFDTDALFAALGADVVHPALVEFTDALDVLADDLDGWQAALTTSDGRVEREAAQVSWRAAMDVLQRLEVMQIGPAGSSLNTVAGEDLRDSIYSWPTVNPCRVDQETLEEGWDSATFFADELVNVQGLDAIEHILWSDEGVSRCPDGVAIIESGDWAAADVQGLRAAYAVALSDQVGSLASRLVAAWDPQDGDWGGVLAAAGDGISPYEDRLDALNAVFHGLFYVETTAKDRKLAQPLGLRDCDEPTVCPGALESQFADAGLDHLAANLAGARAVLTGGEGVGFDDLLAHAGREDLSSQALDALDAAAAAVDAVPGTALSAISDDPDALLAAHDAIKVFTDLLKGEFAAALLLDIPTDAAGDND